MSLLAAHLALANGCSKKGKIGPQTVPHSLFFIIRKEGSRLDDATLNGMKMFYWKGTVKTEVNDFQRATAEGYDLGVQTTRNIGFISSDENIKDFFLEYPGGDVDTLFVDYRHVSENEAFNNPCYCYYPLEMVKYNGSTAYPDSSITQQKVYKFIKP